MRSLPLPCFSASWRPIRCCLNRNRNRRNPPQKALQPSNGPATFGISVNTVMEAVSVKDKNGKPIEGLTAKDFVITEDNVPQTITFCEFQKMEDNVLPPIEAPAAAPIPAAEEKEKPAVGAVTRLEIMPEAPGDLKYRDRRLLALYFDMTAMPIPDQLRALDAAEKFIAKQMKAADLMAIIKYDGEAVRVLVDFTANRDDLLKAINKMAVGEGSGSGRTRYRLRRLRHRLGLRRGRQRIQSLQYQSPVGRPADSREDAEHAQ